MYWIYVLWIFFFEKKKCFDSILTYVLGSIGIRRMPISIIVEKTGLFVEVLKFKGELWITVAVWGQHIWIYATIQKTFDNDVFVLRLSPTMWTILGVKLLKSMREQLCSRLRQWHFFPERLPTELAQCECIVNSSAS